jgi:glycosyltransferase involved in cell wall biosynthesis
MNYHSWSKISIITPSYNQGQFLEETILSVLNQGYPNLEHIIIDGGSTDNSIEIIKKYQEHLTYWVSEPDKGQSDAINKGFSIATGEILAWLNSDDIYMPGALIAVAEFFNKNEDVDCVYGDMAHIDDKGELLYIALSIPYSYNRHLFGISSIPQPATFFRRKALERVGNLDTSLQYQMDYEFFLRFNRCGLKIGNIKEVLASFRLHNTSKTVSQYTNKVSAANKKIIDKYRGKKFNNKTLDNFYLRSMKWKCRLQGFLIRALTRRDAIPFRGAYYRQKMEKQ